MDKKMRYVLCMNVLEKKTERARLEGCVSSQITDNGTNVHKISQTGKRPWRRRKLRTIRWRRVHRARLIVVVYRTAWLPRHHTGSTIRQTDLSSALGSSCHAQSWCQSEPTDEQMSGWDKFKCQEYSSPIFLSLLVP